MGKYECSDLGSAPEQSERPAPDRRFPADFAPDEMVFADALRDAFPIECEELPPLYSQTLLGDATHSPIDKQYEQRLTYRVFQRLGLARPLPKPYRLALLDSWRPNVVGALRRMAPSSAALVACTLLFMVVSVIAASPSFADGVRLLLGHSGVEQVPSYPSSTRPSASMVTGPNQSSAADHPLKTIEWMGAAVHGYSFQAAYVNPPQEWTDGPLVELRYVRSDTTAGSGVLDVREFRPSPTLAGVLQLVADGSANPVLVNGLPGVYVDGQWVPSTGRPIWQAGVKSELIFERDGLVFWIVADQRDGMGAAALVDTATHLTVVPLRTLVPDRSSLRLVSLELQGSLQSPIEGEVLELIPAGSSLDSGTGAFVTYRPGMPLAH